MYLTDEQRRLIDAASAVEGVTMAEIIRRALNAYLSNEMDPTRALAATFGAEPEATIPSRDTWHRG